MTRWSAWIVIGLIAVATARTAAQCELQKLIASDTAERDGYGYSVGASGPTIVIGSPSHGVTNEGAAYVYAWDGATWGDEVQLTAPDALPHDGLGQSVAIDGDVVVCGAIGVDDPGSNAGAAYVFRRQNASWSFEARLRATDARPEAWFGIAVAISGDTIVVGASKDDTNGVEAGAAYVFRRSESGWGQEAKLLAPTLVDRDAFGSAVAIDAGVAIVGAPGHGEARGRTFAFRYDGAAWPADPGPLLGDDVPDAHFGSAVDINGALAIVGAPGEMDDTGAAYAFVFDGKSWMRRKRIEAPGGQAHESFGRAVALDVPNAVIGAPFTDVGGAAYLFDTETWTDLARLTGSEPKAFDRFGDALAVDGETILAGAYKDDDGGKSSGSAYAYATRGPDCNNNGRGDCLDIAFGSSNDCNGDGIPDECALAAGPDRTAMRKTILVPADYPTIQAALDAAEDGDEVVVANGTYTGEGNSDLDFDGKAVVLRSEDCDPDRCVIDCDYAGRGFIFDSGETAATQVSGFTIMRGRGAPDGGGIYLSFSSPTITNCTILLCYSTTGDGGGLYSAGGDPSLINCTFNANSAGVNNGHGGAIEVHQGRPNITGCVFVGNTAPFEGAMRLYVVDPTTVRDCLFLANYGARFFGGGAVAVENSTGIRLVDCVFDSNVTRLIGGGFYGVFSECTLERCDFRHNTAGRSGGAVFGSETSTVLSECSFRSNTAVLSGGAVANEDGSACEIVDCVFESNSTAGDGGAVSNRDGLVTISRCIVRENGALRGGGLFSDAAGMSVVGDSRFCGNDPTNIEGPYADEGGNDITRLCTGPCPADADGDSVVGMSDVLAVLTQWGPCPPEGTCAADIDESGIVDFADLLAIIAAWGPCPKETL